MTDPSKDQTRYNQGEQRGFFGSSIFKIMIAVMVVALAGVGFMYYNGKQATDDRGEATSSEQPVETPEVEAVAEPAALTVIEARTSYKYAETGSTFTLVDDGGPGPYEFTCTAIADIKTSSVLASQGKASYVAKNMTDMEESTAWAEGQGGFGIGESIEFTLTDEYKKWGYTNDDFIANQIYGDFVIQTGYAKSPVAWKNNGRPWKFKCFLNGEPVSIVQLRDTPDFQVFSIFPEQTERVKLKEGDVIRFEILEVVPGAKDQDACISEFHVGGSCG